MIKILSCRLLIKQNIKNTTTNPTSGQLDALFSSYNF
jgi:hypothetical protein